MQGQMAGMGGLSSAQPPLFNDPRFRISANDITMPQYAKNPRIICKNDV